MDGNQVVKTAIFWMENNMPYHTQALLVKFITWWPYTTVLSLTITPIPKTDCTIIFLFLFYVVNFYRKAQYTLCKQPLLANNWNSLMVTLYSVETSRHRQRRHKVKAQTQYSQSDRISTQKFPLSGQFPGISLIVSLTNFPKFLSVMVVLQAQPTILLQ